MAESKSILHELYVFSEWKPEPEYIQKSDSILPENLSTLWRWLKFFGPKKNLIDSVAAHKEKQQKWHIALGDEGKVLAVLTDNILEIRTKRSEYATIAARTTVSRDAYSQWRKLAWSPDCSFLVLAYGNGVVSFFDLTASNLFNIPADCSRPGGLECTDNTHAVCDIIFMPLRVKDTKWSWEVLVVTYDGRLRGYVVSQTEGCKLRHTFRFPGGLAAITYCAPHDVLFVAGVPRGLKDPSSPLTAGITAWRVLNDDPFYKLSVVSDQLEAQLANEKFQLYIPYLTSRTLNFVVRMEVSQDGGRLVCVHCNGDVSVWRLPLLRLERRWPLLRQPHHRLENPLRENIPSSEEQYHPADVNWWSDQEIILTRFSGAVSVCDLEELDNILGKRPEFFQGTPQITRAHDGAFMVLECESNILPAKKSRSDESMEVVKVEEVVDDTMLEVTKELLKTVLYAITDMETFQPKPKKITVVSRIYRLLGVKSTTPTELFSRKIESGHYAEALSLAENFGLDSDLVYQQQWRKNPVSTHAINNYLSKVSKKIWAVHQCVDRLPETLSAANELLQFGLQLTNERILDEINKDKHEDDHKDPDDITLEDLNAYTSELLRCRHVMLFYKERLSLYESILKCEKSTYSKEEYDRLRSNSIVHSATELAKEDRIDALTCLWPLIREVPMQLAVLDKLPETTCPVQFQHLLPAHKCLHEFAENTPVKFPSPQYCHDWCRKEIFRSIWSSNWSEDTTPENENAELSVDYGQWYERRAREIEERSGLASHALALVTLASLGGDVEELDGIIFHLLTLNTLLYDLNIEDVTLRDVEAMNTLETCKALMKMSTPENFVADLKGFVVPYLGRYEKFSGHAFAYISGLTEYLESISVKDLSPVLLVLQSPTEFGLDARTHLMLAECCLFAHTGIDQLDTACDLLNTLLKESDGGISGAELVRRVGALERLVGGASRLAWRGVHVPLRQLRNLLPSDMSMARLLTRLARSLPNGNEKPTVQDWESVLKDILELHNTLFHCISLDQCYEIYGSALLASGEASSIRLASSVLSCSAVQRRPTPYERAVALVLSASGEYINSASSLLDPALDLARTCLTLIEDENEEIQMELDLIAALPLLGSFGLTILPIQVRLCEDKMSLIEECLKLDRSAYLASHKLLKLARLLRIAGDDDQTREGLVLQLVGEQALAAGAAGGAVAVSAARRLAALRHAPSAPLLAAAAQRASTRAHADTPTRRALLAAAAAHCSLDALEGVLRARLGLEIENMEQMGTIVKDQWALAGTRHPSFEDEFADAITTPVIERKDLVPAQKVPIFNYLIETFQNKFNFGEGDGQIGDTASSEDPEKSVATVHCQEFYHSLYPKHSASRLGYGYDKFSVGNAPHGVGSALLSWYYVHASLDDLTAEAAVHIETQVVQKCAEELVFKDTPYSVACLLRSTQDCAETMKMLYRMQTVAISAVLYAVLIKCNSPELRDNVYLATPKEMARASMQANNASPEQARLVRQCVSRLACVGDVERLRRAGIVANALLFNGDDDYRQEIIYSLARCEDPDRVSLACSMGRRHGLDELAVWLAHAAHVPSAQRAVEALPALHDPLDAHRRIKEALWCKTPGNAHGELLDILSLLQLVDERPLISGLSAAEHVKLLKKAKAASPDLNYKLLLDGPSAQQFNSHLLSVMKPENAGMVVKFLRGLPPALKIPIPPNTIFTSWLTKYFFSVPMNTSNKKWMQQYRQCSSYFTKLSKEDLLQFVENTCFSSEAVLKVPHGTRNLMIMQAVDYCQQEQENNYKFNKNEPSWASVGQQLSRWASFLEGYYGGGPVLTVDCPDLEMSHGDVGKALVACADVLMHSYNEDIATGLRVLLKRLQMFEEIPPHAIVQYALDNYVKDLPDLETLVGHVTEFYKAGDRFPEELVESLLRLSATMQLAPHRQLGLLALSGPARGADLRRRATSSADLLTTLWKDERQAPPVTDDMLLTEEGRREIFTKYMALSDTWEKQKALVDVLTCWPPTNQGDKRSLHCEFLHSLLMKGTDHYQILVLIKLLLNQHLLEEKEVKWLCENTSPKSISSTLWIVLLNKCEHAKEMILQVVVQYKESLEDSLYGDKELIKELLDSGYFIPLVPTALYTHILQYILSPNTYGYNAAWAIEELKKSNYVAEAGQLHLVSTGIPEGLRGFTQSVLYFKKILNQ